MGLLFLKFSFQFVSTGFRGGRWDGTDGRGGGRDDGIANGSDDDRSDERFRFRESNLGS